MTTDAEMVECEYCGDDFKESGLSVHQRYCDHIDADESENSLEEDAQSSDSDSLRDDVLDRDDEACLVCGDDDKLVTHVVDEDEPDELVNRLTLCVDCDEDFIGLHPLTKRTKAHH